MPSCTLEIGGRIVASAEGGPFDAEYALFEAHEIELRSNNEPGTVREHGYRTTAELARERLEMEGVTHTLAEAAAGELGALATTYALGPEVRRVVTLLTASELFEGHVWQATSRHYDGFWLDVAALATDSGIDGAARALQQLYLATLLAEVAPESNVYLSTVEYTAGRRPGERTHRRVSLATASALPEAIRTLGDRPVPARSQRGGGPSRAELLDNIRTRLAAGVLESSRASLEAIERALSVRDRPHRGPLADPEVWALEVQLAEGDPTGVIEKIDALERARGRQPVSAYLRGRAALLHGAEDPRVIAERASSLAMSMNSFPELELLAAEAWSRAGDSKRALAYARDLAENPQVDPAIRARARALVEPTRESAPPIARPPSVVPPFTPVPPPPSQRPPASQRPPRSESAPIVSITAGMRASVSPSKYPSGSALSLAALAESQDELVAPSPIVSIGVGPLSRSSAPPIAPSELAPNSSSAILAAQRASQSSMRAPTLAPPPAVTRPSMPAAASEMITERQEADPFGAAAEAIAVARPSVHPPSPEEEDDGQDVLARGGSQPPFRTEPPPADFPAAPLVPRLEADRVEKAETLSLPPGATGDAEGTSIPTNPFEARVYFTMRARELGLLYRKQYNVELRTDLRSLELLQRYLAERFESGELHSVADIETVQLHGAFVSELLARRLGAEWTDLAVSEMGYWSMNVPPGTTVWPIGRVIRFVTMQHRERDLVSYFLELQARAHGLT